MEAWTRAQAVDVLIRKHGVTLANGAARVPPRLSPRRNGRPGEPLYPTVRDFPGGGAPKPPQLHDELRDGVGGVGIASGYGMTEAPIVASRPTSTTDDDAQARRRHARSRRRDRARRPSTATSPPGEEGEIVVKGPQVMRGYVDSSLDADAFTDDGCFRTGDLGGFDAHGYVIITGRLKDIIIRKGENISAKEVEDLLYAHPKVADVAVIGIPDAERGEMVCAFVVPADPADPPTLDEIVEHCREPG